jgi:hypothetical protein
VPDANASGLTKSERTSGNPPSPVPVTIPSSHLNTFSLALDSSYEVDFWGRMHRSVESARAEAESSAADYQNVMLALTGDVAANYFQLRAFDTELATLRRTQDSREKSLALIQQRLEGGLIPESDCRALHQRTGHDEGQHWREYRRVFRREQRFELPRGVAVRDARKRSGIHPVCPMRSKICRSGPAFLMSAFQPPGCLLKSGRAAPASSGKYIRCEGAKR